ncbi:bacterioferritin-associated ferredoxin [Arsenicicoccus cauae]|uniref:(2Fe-2S)-binding protein n=1 Tax=Arsenicicoccus cauae TaxID=2663847 RepID=UPI00370D3FE1
MIVCHCRIVRDTEILEVAAAEGPTLGAVCRSTGAGTVCGGCVPAVRSLLQRFREDSFQAVGARLTLEHALAPQLARLATVQSALEDSHAAA